LTALCFTANSAVHAWEFMICQQWAAVISSISRLFSVTISKQCVRYTSEQCVFLYDTYVKYGSAWKCRGKFRFKFRDERVPSRKTIHNLVNELRSTGLLIDKKKKHKRRVLTGEKSDDIGARLKYTPRKSLTRLAQETGVWKSSARAATQLLKLRLYKTTVIHACICRRRWDRSAIDILSWWSVISLAGIHKYTK
jgi:hypothetical protein